MEEKDLHYLSVLGTRKRAVSQLPIEVEPAGEDDVYKQDAQLVRDWLDRDLLESELFDVLDAVGKGVSTTEIIWQMTAAEWLPRAIKWRHPQWFEFDRTDWRNAVAARRPGWLWRAMPAAGGQVHHPCASGQERPADPQRFGQDRRLGLHVQELRHQGLGDVPEAYGHPIRIGKYSLHESEENNASWSGRSTAWARTRGGFP
jgi:phage gp29-like protein